MLSRQPFILRYGHCPLFSPLWVSRKDKNVIEESLVYLLVQFTALQLTGIAFLRCTLQQNTDSSGLQGFYLLVWPDHHQSASCPPLSYSTLLILDIVNLGRISKLRSSLTTSYKSDLGRVVQTGNFLLLDHHTTKYIHITKMSYTVDCALREQEIQQLHTYHKTL